MKNIKHLIITGLAVIAQLFTPMAMAADSAEGIMDFSGSVPTIFSLTTRGIPGDLDLTPNVVVNDRLMGILHLKYNVDLASLTLESNTASGQPEDGGATAYAFGAAGFKFKFNACTSVDPLLGGVLFVIDDTTPLDVAETAALTAGIEEDCELTASWAGTTTILPLAGVYSMTVKIIMTSI